MSGFKSEKQRLKFNDLAKQGKISQKIVQDWIAITPNGIPSVVQKKEVPAKDTDRLKRIRRDK